MLNGVTILVSVMGVLWCIGIVVFIALCVRLIAMRELRVSEIVFYAVLLSLSALLASRTIDELMLMWGL